jgi:limonene-1,2-epoxide hydrolase
LIPSVLGVKLPPSRAQQLREVYVASDSVGIVTRFCDAFTRRDPDEILEFFTDDAIYHNMPMPPVQGKAGIKTVLDMFLKPAQSVEFIVLKIAEGEDGAVLTERLDKFVLGGKNIELPVMGVFELNGGKIAAWRDYFDMAAWTRQTA